MNFAPYFCNFHSLSMLAYLVAAFDYIKMPFEKEDKEVRTRLLASKYVRIKQFKNRAIIILFTIFTRDLSYNNL